MGSSTLAPATHRASVLVNTEPPQTAARRAAGHVNSRPLARFKQAVGAPLLPYYQARVRRPPRSRRNTRARRRRRSAKNHLKAVASVGTLLSTSSGTMGRAVAGAVQAVTGAVQAVAGVALKGQSRSNSLARKSTQKPPRMM